MWFGKKIILPGNASSRNAFVRQFDASGNEISYHALGGSFFQGETPAVSVLSNGMTVAAANEIRQTAPFDTNLNVKLIRYDGSVEKNLVLSEGNTPADGRYGSRLDRPNIVDLGNSQFMISYSPTNITNAGGNGGMAQIFDYSGSFLRGFSIINDTSNNEVWIEKPVLLDSNNLAVPCTGSIERAIQLMCPLGFLIGPMKMLWTSL